MLTTPLSLPGSATLRNREAGPAPSWARPRTLYAAISAALLSACAGLPAVVPGGAADAGGPVAKAPPAVQTPVKPERMRAMSARDILQEWGVYGPASKARKGKAAGPRTASLAIEVADFSASTQEIVANATCRYCEQKPYHKMVLQASNLYGVPSGLIHAVIQKESGYNPGARSSRDARGLMQVTPGTARFVGVEKSDSLYDPQTNINAGAAYLKYLMRNHNTFDTMLAAYNSGPGNVRKYKGVPPFSETRRYVSDVKRYYAMTSRDVP